jgi:hypothetical protein
MKDTTVKSILFLLFILVAGLYLAPFYKKVFEGFKGYKRYKSDVLTVPGDFPRSVDKPILDDYPLIENKGVSANNASDIWKDYPVFGVGSFKQITNNIRYNRNPDDGKCSRAEFCGALYHDAKHLPNVIKPLPPAQEGPGARVGYYRSEPNDLFFSIPTNENILY